MGYQHHFRRVWVVSFGLVFLAACNTSQPVSLTRTTVAPQALLSAPKWVNPLPIPPLAQPTGTNAFTIYMRQAVYDFGLGGPTTSVWGYTDGTSPGGYLGPTILARSNTPISINWVNQLPTSLPFAQDPLPTMPGPMEWASTGVGSAVPHVHGGRSLPQFDGLPDNYFPPGQSRVFQYQNDQPAGTIWYHDHALGFTRLNVYAGLAGAYPITDRVEDRLNIPKFDAFDVPLIVQDKSFNDNGSLFYPPSWEPEFFGDTAIVNGKAFPYLNVQPRKYRFRLVNGSNARVYRLAFSSVGGASLTINQIGAEGGFLPCTARLSKLLISPGERADVIVDFSRSAGQTVTLTNDADTPFGGTFNPAGGDPPLPQIMQFKVSNTSVTDRTTIPVAPGLSTILQTSAMPFNGLRVRNLTLNEQLDENGDPVRLLLGTLNPDGSANPLMFRDPITEKPKLNSLEVWNLVNNTVDVHPIHLHLVQFRVIDRRAVIRDAARKVTGFGPSMPPAANETGWKDTVNVYPDQATRIVARFDTLGKFVWHCHILEHEENDMMRPFEVVP